MSNRWLGGFISASNNPLLQLGAPTIGTATAGDAQASVTFTAPATGTPTSYTVLSSGGQTASGSSSPITVTGLTNGTAYTFTVFANNAYGPSAASAASNSVTPVAPITKIYFEFDYYSTDSNGGWGFTTNSTLAATHPSEQGTNFIGFRSNGEYGVNGTGFSYSNSVGSYSSATTRFGIALDKDTGAFWVRKGSSSWVSGDPTAGTGYIGTIPGVNANTKLYFTGYTGDYLFSRAVADYSYSAPSGFTAERTNAFYTSYTLNSVTFGEGDYKATDNSGSGYSGAYILLPTTYS